MIILVDSTVLIDALRSSESAGLRDAVNQGHTLATSAVHVAELYAGMRPNEEQVTMELLAELECYVVTAKIAKVAGLLQRTWRNRGRTFKLPDMLIAATAMEHGAALMTSNRKNFPMPELIFYPPDDK